MLRQHAKQYTLLLLAAKLYTVFKVISILINLHFAILDLHFSYNSLMTYITEM